MTLARPEYLWLLACLPVCAVFGAVAAARRRRLAVSRPDLPLPAGRRRLRVVLFLAGLGLVALAAAGPQWGLEAVAARPAARARLVVALDCSRSMLARDLRPDRLGAAKGLVLDVLVRLPGFEAGLVGFAGRAWLACPVTADRTGLAVALEGLSPAEAPLGGTSLAAALEASRLALLGAGPGPGAVLVVSDGEDTAPGAEDAGGAAAGPAGGPPVFTVAVGGAAPVAVPLPGEAGGVLRDKAGQPVLVGVDPGGLTALAERHGGRAFRLGPDAPGPAAALAAALADLAPDVAPDAAGAEARPTDRTETVLLAGFLLLLLDFGLAPAGRATVAMLLVLALAGPARADNRAGDHFAKGLDAYAAGRYEAALHEFLAARVFEPDRPEILLAIGAVHYRSDRFEAARKAFARAGQGAPPGLLARARYNEGNAAYRLGDIDGAIGCYEAALALAPDDADARANLDWLRSRRNPPPSGSEDREKAGGPGGQGGSGPDADGKESGKEKGSSQAAREGAAGDDGRGGRPEGEQTAAGAPDPARPDDPAAPAAPVPAREGEKVGERRAQAAGAASDPVLDRIPDLPGLPEPPHYGRPAVEKDW